MADPTPVEIMLTQLGLKYTKNDEKDNSARYIVKYNDVKTTIVANQKECTFIVHRTKKIASELRVQVAHLMQQRNMRLKIGAFQIDMKDGEAIFLSQRNNLPMDKDKCVAQLTVLHNISMSTYQIMDQIISEVSKANPSVAVDANDSLSESTIFKFLGLALGEQSSGTKQSQGGGGKSAEDAQLRLILQLLALNAKLDARIAPQGGLTTFSTNFKKAMESFLIDPKEIVFHKDSSGQRIILGEGAFGVVYRGTLYDTMDVAIKQIKYKGHASYETFKQEAKIMKQLNNKNIVTFCGVAIIDKQLHIVSEFCAQGSLQKYLDDSKDITVSKALALAKEAASGLNYIHRKDYIHRDVKPGNFLVHEDHLKLSDFGLTTLIQNSKDAPAAGTILYLAPEICLEQPITTKVDVFAFGIVLWEILHPTQKLYPFIKRANFYKEYEMHVAKMNKRMEISPQLPSSVAQLIQDCWAPDPEERPTMAQVFARLELLQAEYAQAQSQAKALAEAQAQAQSLGDKGQAQTLPLPRAVHAQPQPEAHAQSQPVPQSVNEHTREMHLARAQTAPAIPQEKSTCIIL